MMPKILKPYTIIPQDLYVQRDADRQVRHIIEDMGRPGYVLVSRQMGKTNLLLNAKRNLQTIDNVFVYVDLSNTFNDARTCFENIIDIAVETNYEKFGKIWEAIKERRKELKDTPPHKQHNNELRILLQALNGGKLVIILDEIDALTKTDYSDQIFSQIRSSYFASRVNFQEFYNLTYLLSGVVEPNEIIKDPKISPFNIGQKIFLNDFSKNEFEELISKSDLNLSGVIKDRIFYWTNGNPRITWDLCSEVENKLKTENITIEEIDKIVNDLYLTTFDKPPIDNIRELVKKDRELRNSIVELEYNKGSEISDSIKSKLYLAGIINYDENSVVIKNEIIKRSLSLDWIRSLEQGEKNTLTIALEHYEKNRYPEAIAAFEEYLKYDSFPDSNRDTCYYYLGYAYYLQRNYKKALEYYHKVNFDLEDTPKYHYNLENLKALAFKGDKDYIKSKERYEYVIANSKKDDNFLQASLSLGHLFMNNFLGDRKEESIKIFSSIVNDEYNISDKVKENTLNDIKCMAYYNLADLAIGRGDYKEARTLINRGLPLATNITKSSLLLQLSSVTEELEERTNLLNEIVDYLTGQDPNEIEQSPEKPLDFAIVDIYDVLISLYETNQAAFERVILEKKVLSDNKSHSQQLFDLGLHAIQKGNWNIAVKLLQNIYDKMVNEDFEVDYLTKYNTLKILAYTNNYKENLDIPVEYLELFEADQTVLIDYLDFEIFSSLIFELIEDKEYNEALYYINLIKSRKDFVEEQYQVNYLAIFHLELNAYYLKNDKENTILKANEILSLIESEKFDGQNSNLLGETGLDFIKQNTKAVLDRMTKKQMPIRNTKTYGRNDIVKVRYKDGTTVEAKYKKIENDLNSGECLIITT